MIRYPLNTLPMLIMHTSFMSVAKQRINKFLCSDELDQEAITHEDDGQGNAIKINRASFAWSKKESSPYLQDINLDIKQGRLVAVVGQVGSGKSAFVSGLLGDMEKTSGSVNISGDVAYVPQQ